MESETFGVCPQRRTAPDARSEERAVNTGDPSGEGMRAAQLSVGESAAASGRRAAGGRLRGADGRVAGGWRAGEG